MTGPQFLEALEGMHQTMLNEIKAHIDLQLSMLPALFQLVADIRVVQGADPRLVDPTGEKLKRLLAELEKTIAAT
jgi:hypothetical protein